MKHVTLLAALVVGALLLAACGTTQQAGLDNLDDGVSRLAVSQATTDNGVEPILVDSGPGGNATCGIGFPYASTRFDDVGGNVFTVELFERAADGTVDLDAIVGTVQVTVSADPVDGFDVIAWQVMTGDIVIKAVIVKGSNASHIYNYGSGATSDSGLVAPVNASGKPAGLSNITFCGDDDDDDRVIDEICEWSGETAWADGDRYVRRGNWATYTSYQAGATVTVYAGQTVDVGTVEFGPVVDGKVEITITLKPGVRLAQEYDEDGNELGVAPEAVKIQGYGSAPSGNPAPGGFTTYKGNELVITVDADAFYGIHLDVEIEVCD